jgi:NAD(P)H-hydrate epimerase
MKELERRADEAGLSYYQMMENAGSTAYEMIMAEQEHFIHKACVFCGKGNNAGDGFVIARKLREHGEHVRVVLVAGEPTTPDAITNYQLIKEDVEIIRLYESEPEHAKDILEKALSDMKEDDVLIDAIFGTGFHGSPRGNAAVAIDYMIAHRGDRVIYAIDIPSGMAGDEEGEVRPEKAVYADFTISFHARKPVHVNQYPMIADHLGQVVVADIGIGDAIENAGR